MKWILRGKLSERAMHEERGWEEKGSGGCSGGPGQELEPFFKCHVCPCLKVASFTLKDCYEVEEALKYIFGRSVHICFLLAVFCQHFCENRAIIPALEARSAESSRPVTSLVLGPTSVEEGCQMQCTLASVLFLSPSLSPVYCASKSEQVQRIQPS